MKLRLLVVLAFALSAAFVAGCHGHCGTVGLKDGLEEMGLENAPALGPAFRQFVVDYDEKEYCRVYEALSKGSRDELARQLKGEIAEEEAAIAWHKEQLADKNHPYISRDFHGWHMKEAKKRLKLLKSFRDDLDDYLAYKDRQFRNPSNIATKMAAGKIRVAGEQIDGEKGSITLTDGNGEPLRPMIFVKENGAWKVDLFETSVVKPDEQVAPPYNPEPIPPDGGGQES
jgi:hypothetical protein